MLCYAIVILEVELLRMLLFMQIFMLPIATLFSFQIKYLHVVDTSTSDFSKQYNEVYSFYLWFCSIPLILLDSSVNHVWRMYPNFLSLICYCKVELYHFNIFLDICVSCKTWWTLSLEFLKAGLHICLYVGFLMKWCIIYWNIFSFIKWSCCYSRYL